MLDVYDDEREKIYLTVQAVQEKYSGQAANGDNLMRLQHELVGRLEDLGFGATVDVTPIFEGQPVSVRIDSRLDNKPFDAERKRWEVKHRQDHDLDDTIEGAV